jgi:hypothetical protein
MLILGVRPTTHFSRPAATKPAGRLRRSIQNSRLLSWAVVQPSPSAAHLAYCCFHGCLQASCAATLLSIQRLQHPALRILCIRQPPAADSSWRSSLKADQQAQAKWSAMTVAEVAAVVGPVAADLATVKIRELYRTRPEAETEKVLPAAARRFWISPASGLPILDRQSCRLRVGTLRSCRSCSAALWPCSRNRWRHRHRNCSTFHCRPVPESCAESNQCVLVEQSAACREHGL